MPREWVKLIKLFLIPAIFLMAMAGGGGHAAPDISDTYALESVSSVDGGQSSRVYRAVNKTVPEVAEELVAIEEPEEMSAENTERMFLVYTDAWYHLQQDPQNPADTIVQKDTKEFVEKNYESSFLKAYFVASVLEDVLDGMSSSGGSYRGYSSKEVNKPGGTYSTPDKASPPVTKEGTGSIIKRSSQKPDQPATVGSGGSLFDKQSDSTTKSSGKIIRNSSSSKESSSSKSSSIFSPSKKSPPKTKVGGSGRITKRR